MVLGPMRELPVFESVGRVRDFDGFIEGRTFQLVNEVHVLFPIDGDGQTVMTLNKKIITALPVRPTLCR